MKSFARRHFPSDKAKFKLYLKTFLPIIIGSTLYALNGVVDNFMVGNIEQGVTALGAINSWTGIMIGWFIAVAAAGSVTMAQFYYDKKYDIVKKISRYRFFLSFLPIIPFFIIAQINPDILTKVFLVKGDSSSASATYAYTKALEEAAKYAKVIAFQWLVFSFSFNFGNQLREVGHAKITMIWGIGTLITNITLNAVLMFVFDYGVAGAAWASFAARIVAVTFGVIYIAKKKLPINYNIFKFYDISKKIQITYWKRWPYLVSIFTVIFFITLRTSFYSMGYSPSSSHLGKGVHGLSVVGLTGALMSVFTTTFSSLASMAAVFVSSELGKGNKKQAKINGDELKGFSTLVAASLSVLIVIFATLLPYMTFFSKDQYDKAGQITFEASKQLAQVKNSLYVIAFYYPVWIWFSSSYRIGNAGGKGWKFALTDWIISGPLQLGWVALTMLVIVPSSPVLQNNFALGYAIFFLSDFLKLFFQEWFYYKDKSWLHSITKEEYHKIKASGEELVSEDVPN